MKRIALAAAVFLTTVAVSLGLYWLAGGKFERGPALACTIFVGLWVGMALVGLVFMGGKK